MKIGVSTRKMLRSLLLPENLVAQPFLHLERDHIYNPLTDKTLRSTDDGYRHLRAVVQQGLSRADLDRETIKYLFDLGWLVSGSVDQSKQSHLRYVEVETNTYCNQACCFCPVAEKPRAPQSMPLEFFERIIEQLSDYKQTLLIVSLFRYNEPTVEKHLVDLVKIIRSYGLPPAMNTNATGLTPARTDQLIEAGGLRFMSVNLSTLDPELYREERGRDQLGMVMRNLDYVKDKPLADRMDLAVLGRGDEQHKRNYASILQHFAGSRFNVQSFEVMDRAGHLPEGQKPSRRHTHLCGCMQTGSRPLQWLHITPAGKCVLCCEDYDEEHVVGDLHKQSVNEVLASPGFAQLRRWVYGHEEAPDDFICRKCIFARTRNQGG